MLRNLAQFFRFPSMRFLHMGELSPAVGSNKPKKRVGRGRALGGRFCGRGAAGQNSRSGPGLPRGFAGGQTPLHISTPKFEFKDPFKKQFSLISLGKIQHLIDSGRIDASKPITMKTLFDAGFENLQDGIKIMGNGREYFRSKIFIEVTQFSSEAINRIEELGGTAVAVHHTPLSLKALTRPYLFENRILPRSPPPVHTRDRQFYSNPANRGYLVDELWQKCSQADPGFEKRYIRAEPMPLPEPPMTFSEFLASKLKSI